MSLAGDKCWDEQDRESAHQREPQKSQRDHLCLHTVNKQTDREMYSTDSVHYDSLKVTSK